MPLFEGSTVQIELPEDSGAFGLIPSVGQQNAAYVPENCADLDHVCTSDCPGRLRDDKCSDKERVPHIRKSLRGAKMMLFECFCLPAQ
jgi:hypothetical protein